MQVCVGVGQLDSCAMSRSSITTVVEAQASAWATAWAESKGCNCSINAEDTAEAVALLVVDAAADAYADACIDGAPPPGLSRNRTGCRVWISQHILSETAGSAEATAQLRCGVELEWLRAPAAEPVDS